VRIYSCKSAVTNPERYICISIFHRKEEISHIIYLLLHSKGTFTFHNTRCDGWEAPILSVYIKQGQGNFRQCLSSGSTVQPESSQQEAKALITSTRYLTLTIATPTKKNDFLADRTGHASQDKPLALTQRWILLQKEFPCEKHQSVKSKYTVM
jgi:hypothetical protein